MPNKWYVIAGVTLLAYTHSCNKRQADVVTIPFQVHGTVVVGLSGWRMDRGIYQVYAGVKGERSGSNEATD